MAGTFHLKGKTGFKLSTSAYVHIVSYNHAKYIKACLESVLSQQGYEPGKNLTIRVSDNNSSDNTAEVLKDFTSRNVIVTINPGNFGFAAGHNIGFADFLKSRADYYLCLNPDLCLNKDALKKMIEAIAPEKELGSACPKLLRADDSLKPVSPAMLDAAGMYITSSLRHFDRGGGEKDTGQFDKQETVFGGSGACLLLKRDYISDVIFNQDSYKYVINQIYPQLKQAVAERAEVFDEAFFAYREDADLAWRSQLLGWQCLYVPEAVGYHVRKVTPENRAELPREINLLGVKNRFLLQLNNYSFSYGLKAFINGYFFRNILVILVVVLKERSSLGGLAQFIKLFRRGIDRRSILKRRMRVHHDVVALWFDNKSGY